MSRRSRVLAHFQLWRNNSRGGTVESLLVQPQFFQPRGVGVAGQIDDVGLGYDPSARQGAGLDLEECGFRLDAGFRVFSQLLSPGWSISSEMVPGLGDKSAGTSALAPAAEASAMKKARREPGLFMFFILGAMPVHPWSPARLNGG
ncbi:hypothetical protein [Bosea sp. OK403]|uniref:hypothetical protein n=1 Tax=Bosea sp. OK403 TaxID=1855286 RepID=UPI001587CC47|nr:hypothetical protein [Bosea sp. OK403]